MSATASKNATTASELDLDAYRKRNETEREWQLRKLFIERFQDQFEHDRLLCLAQCYVNIKTLGCRYSDRIMNQIKSLTVDFDPIVDERIEPIIKEMREKNPPQQNHSKQKQEKQAKNSPKPQQQQQQPQQQQQQQQNQPKQKLISKTQFVLGSPLKSTPQTNVNSNVAATVTNPVQILARPQQQQQQQPQSQPQQIIQQSPKQSQPPQQQQQQQQPSTPNSKKLGQTAAVATAQSQNLLGKSPAASSGVPVMAGSGEAAPNPALLPIPFGLQSSSSPSMSGGGKPAVRNALLAQFSSSSSSSSPANPLAILTAGVAGGAAAVSVPLPPLVDDQNFRRLARVNKLRDVLRDDQPQLHVDENFDWSAYIEQKCASVGVNIAYNQFEYKAESTNSVNNPDGCALYYGELILESFRVTINESKKRKKCKSGAFKHAYEILTSKSELAVKQVSAATRRSALLVPSVGKQQSLPIVDFDYELYSLDGSGDVSTHRRIESVAKNLSTSLPTTTTTNVISNQELSNMMSIDQMLKMMILPKDNNKAAAATSMDVTVEEKKTPNEADDDDDENRSQGSDKKSKIKQNLPNFILFIPSSSMNSEEMTLANFDKFLHERNSINVLQNSCAKCKYAFELETKEKKAKSTSKDNGNGSNGKNNASVDQAESDEHDSQNNDGSRIKCKCLINGVKIATASAKNKNDAKRLAALKALKYLFKTFPVFKETSYQSIINNPTNDNSTAAANDATATETSKNALMASLGITPQSQPQTTPQYYKISKEDLFGGLIPPTMFEKSSCGAAAVAVASSQQQLAQTNPSAASSSFGLKMLMKMGWRGDGHGLGKNQQGVAQPIQLDNTVNRFGLGYDEYAQEMAEIDQIESISMMSLDKDKDDVKQEVKKEALKTEAVKQPVVRKPRKVDLINNIRKILIHFANSPSDNDLLFDKSLSAEDRKLIHQEAHKLGLKTRSEGSDQNRFIVVRKNINTSEIIDAAMRNGGQVSRYQVVSKGAV